MNVYFDHSGDLLGHAAGSPRVHFAPDAASTKQWAAALAAARQPESTGHALTLAGLDAILSDPEKLAALRAAASDFRAWLEHWTFVPPGLPPRLLGPTLWEGQAEFARVVGEHRWVYFLKARQLGESTIACAYDGWVARFGPRTPACTSSASALRTRASCSKTSPTGSSSCPSSCACR